MEVNLPSEAERKAAEAQNLQSFSNFSLQGVRSSLKDLLREIGRNDIFSEYTLHDIEHIDALLEILWWIVPKKTVEIMTPADWMLTVLAIYFHDAGMVVTKAEFEKRAQSDFPKFRDKILDSAEPSPYREKINALSADERERFLYQEFVRSHHAERIRCWISGEAFQHLGLANEAASIVAKLVSDLNIDFKRALALVCESHHLDDLGDLKKYDPARAFGTLQKETANVQYAAILLRTVDLLHVTKDRTPSVTFNLVSPNDPKSIEEWAKQMSTVSVRAARPRDESGKVDLTGVPDTVLVSATFEDPLGFFSLTTYLDYAQRELRRCHQWAQQTIEAEALEYQFPWRRIDSSQVIAIDFESRQFAFELDRPKILSLLTGHTLYNNPDVVVRELVQNSIDATRLAREEGNGPGEVKVYLDTINRTLSVDDNGTGMTQQIIEEHFLNVGSSRYRDESFVREHPGFAAISRFGIGILSIFMISDEVEVLTKFKADAEVRRISIRSLNGKYLIRRLKPGDESVPAIIRKHGTSVRLKLRAGVTLPKIKSVAELWIMFPGCSVTVQTDEETPQSVGHLSPKEFLESFLRKLGCNISNIETDEHPSVYQVKQVQNEGLILAYALRWDPYFKNWNFAQTSRLNLAALGQPVAAPTAICLQGIRVESFSPGFSSQDILALCNFVGTNSPETNVARTSLEPGELTDRMFSKIYEIYASQVAEEVLAMSGRRMLPISHAASEGRFLTASLQTALPISQCPEASQLLHDQLRTIRFLTLDSGDKRTLVNAKSLGGTEGFWTVEGNAYASAEDFLKRISGGTSVFKLASLIETPIALPKGEILGGYAESPLVRKIIHDEFEVDRIELKPAERQANLHWSLTKGARLWKGITPSNIDRLQRLDQLITGAGRMGLSTGTRYKSIALQNSDEVQIEGCVDECGLTASSRLFFFKGNDAYDLLEESFNSVERGEESEASFALTILILNLLLSDDVVEEQSLRQRLFNNVRQQVSQMQGFDVKFSGLLQALMEKPRLRLFNPLQGRYRPYGMAVGGGID